MCNTCNARKPFVSNTQTVCCRITYAMFYNILLLQMDLRKVLNTEHGGLRCVRDDWQFTNKNFCKDRPDLLELVKRKVFGFHEFF